MNINNNSDPEAYNYSFHGLKGDLENQDNQSIASPLIIVATFPA